MDISFACKQGNATSSRKSEEQLIDSVNNYNLHEMENAEVKMAIDSDKPEDKTASLKLMVVVEHIILNVTSIFRVVTKHIIL